MLTERQDAVFSSKKSVSNPDFASRLQRVCDEHSETPGLNYGRLGWIQKQLDDRFDQVVSAETVRRWLAGEATPRRDKMVQLASLFEVNIAWLSYGAGHPRDRANATSFADDSATNASPGQNWLDRLRKELAGTVTIPPGVDITEPTGEIWDAEL